MKSKKRFIIAACAAALLAVAAVIYGTVGRKVDSAESVISTNLALLDTDEVPDFELVRNDTLFRFETPVVNLGSMKTGEMRDVNFAYLNVSSKPLIIRNIVTTCGCTSVEWEKVPLMPRKSSEIKVRFEAEKEGVFFKKLFIYYAGSSAPVEIAIKGEIK